MQKQDRCATPLPDSHPLAELAQGSAPYPWRVDTGVRESQDSSNGKPVGTRFSRGESNHDLQAATRVVPLERGDGLVTPKKSSPTHDVGGSALILRGQHSSALGAFDGSERQGRQLYFIRHFGTKYTII